MSKEKKRSRLTRFVSYPYKHKYLDESCFANEVTGDDYLEGDDDMDAGRKTKLQKIATDAAATAFIVGGCVAAFMVACSVTYYSFKGTAGLFKTFGQLTQKVTKH